MINTQGVKMNLEKKIQKIKKGYNQDGKRLPGDVVYDAWWGYSKAAGGIAVLVCTTSAAFAGFDYEPSDALIKGLMFPIIGAGFIGGIYFGEKIEDFFNKKIKKKYEGLIDDNAVTLVEHENKYFIFERLTPQVFKGLTAKKIVEEWNADETYEFSPQDETITSRSRGAHISCGTLRVGALEKKITENTEQETWEYILEKYSDKDLYVRSRSGNPPHYVSEKKC